MAFPREAQGILSPRIMMSSASLEGMWHLRFSPQGGVVTTPLRWKSTRARVSPCPATAAFDDLSFDAVEAASLTGSLSDEPEPNLVDGSDHADRRGSRDGPHSGVQTVDDKPMSRNRRGNRHNNNRVAGVIDMEPGNLLPFEPDMAKASAPAGGEALLIGLEAFIPPRAAIAAGHTSVDVGYAGPSQPDPKAYVRIIIDNQRPL